MDDRLSRNFRLTEFTRSETAARRGITITVQPGSVAHRNLSRLVDLVLQPLRDALGPVVVTSGYRPPEVNRLVGGSPSSQHCEGLAADVVVPGRPPLAVAEWIRDHCPDHDQVIIEFGRWVHVSIAPEDHTPRREALTATRNDAGRTTYLAGLLSDEAA